MPYGRVDPIDLLMVAAPMYFNEYCIRLARISSLALTSLFDAQPTEVSFRPASASSSFVGRLFLSNVVLLAADGAIRIFIAA